MIQLLLVIFGAAFAITGIVLLFKGEGGQQRYRRNERNTFKFMGMEVSVSNSGLFIFAIGCGVLLYGASLKPDIAPSHNQNYSEKQSLAPIATNTPSASPSSTAQSTPAPPTPAPTAKDKTVVTTLSITRPADGRIDFTNNKVRINGDGTSWDFDVGGKCADVPTGKSYRVYTLYHNPGIKGDPWYVQAWRPLESYSADWVGKAYVDKSAFENQSEHTFELRAFITSQELKDGYRVSNDLRKIYTKRQTPAKGKDFSSVYIALSDAVTLTLADPSKQTPSK